MGRHLLIVANGFRAVGLVLGIPSLVLCLWLTGLRLQVARLKPPEPAQSNPTVNIGRDGIVGIVVAGGLVIAKGFELFNNAAGWVASVIQIVTVVLTLAGAFLFFTGRGLVLHAGWARILAGIAASGFLLLSFLAMTALRRGAAFALIPIGLSIYMLWVLIRKFN